MLNGQLNMISRHEIGTFILKDHNQWAVDNHVKSFRTFIDSSNEVLAADHRQPPVQDREGSLQKPAADQQLLL